jgi:ubiquitin-like protein Pup
LATTKTNTKSKKTTKEEVPIESKQSATADQIKKETDALLNKIDDIIDDINAEEFVAKYIQKGGQ